MPKIIATPTVTKPMGVNPTQRVAMPKTVVHVANNVLLDKLVSMVNAILRVREAKRSVVETALIFKPTTTIAVPAVNNARPVRRVSTDHARPHAPAVPQIVRANV